MSHTEKRIFTDETRSHDPGFDFHDTAGSAAAVWLCHSNRGQAYPTVVFDQSLSAASRDVLDSFSASGYFDVTDTVNSFEDVTQKIDSGQTLVGIFFPPDFERNLQRGTSAPVQVIVDASDSMVAIRQFAIANSIGLLKSPASAVKKNEF